jgi:hypothetical protein
VDAVFQSGPNGWDCTESWAHSSPAAKYAKMRDAHPGWNVFDLRQLLRQTCTDYAQWGWDPGHGYGFSQIANAAGMADNFSESSLVQDIQDTMGLDAGPPLQITATVSNYGTQTQVDFTWKNFGQTDFQATTISPVVNGVKQAPFYTGSGTSATWHPGQDVRGTQVRFDTLLYPSHGPGHDGQGFTITLN